MKQPAGRVGAADKPIDQLTDDEYRTLTRGAKAVVAHPVLVARLRDVVTVASDATLASLIAAMGRHYRSHPGPCGLCDLWEAL